MSGAPDLRALVASRGSVRRVAAALGEKRRTLEEWVAGRRKPHPDRLAAIMARLDAMEPVGDGRASPRPKPTSTSY